MSEGIFETIIAKNHERTQEFDVEQFRKDKAAERQEVFDMQESGLLAAFTSHENFCAYLDKQAQWPLITAGNVATIMAQMPDAERVETKAGWEALKRKLIDNPVEIKMLGTRKNPKDPKKSFFEVITVYDLSQTVGAPLKQQPEKQIDNPQKFIAAIADQITCRIYEDNGICKFL